MKPHPLNIMQMPTMHINEIQEFYITSMYTLANNITKPNVKQNRHTLPQIRTHFKILTLSPTHSLLWA